MRPACILVLALCAVASASLAQQPAGNDQAAAPPPSDSSAPVLPPHTAPSASGPSTSTASEAPAPAPDTQGASEVPVEAEPFDARVHRRIEEYGQRHQQRDRQMATYDKVSGSDPGLERFADPRRVQVELSDELDRERTSEELAGDYAEQAHSVQSKIQALREFIAKRRQAGDALSKQNGAVPRQDLEVAIQPVAQSARSTPRRGRRGGRRHRDSFPLSLRRGEGGAKHKKRGGRAATAPPSILRRSRRRTRSKGATWTSDPATRGRRRSRSRSPSP